MNYLGYTFINNTFSYISINSHQVQIETDIHWTRVWLLNFRWALAMLCLQSRPENERWAEQWPCLGCHSCMRWRVHYCPAKTLIASRCFYLLCWKYFFTKGQEWLLLLLKLVPLTIVKKPVYVNYIILWQHSILFYLFYFILFYYL